jgi:hypothetical protein
MIFLWKQLVRVNFFSFLVFLIENQEHFPDMVEIALGAFLFLRFLCPALVTPGAPM